MAKVESVPLGEVAEIERSVIDPAAIAPDEVCLSLEDLDADSGRIVKMRAREAPKSAKFRFSPRHVLYGKLRPYLCKVARSEIAGVCSTDILPIAAGPTLDRDYLFHFLRTPEFTAKATNAAVGVNLPRISPAVLSTFAIPLPPLEGQRRIAEILDKADALRAKRRAALAQLDTLTQSIFLEMFGDPARNTRGLRTMVLAELGEWRSGGTPPRTRSEYFNVDGSGIPWFSSGELNEMYATRSVETITEDALLRRPPNVCCADRSCLGCTTPRP